MTTFPLVLDSSFRDTEMYPSPASFSLQINDPTPRSFVNLPLCRFTWGQESLSRDGTIISANTEQLFLSDSLRMSTDNDYRGCTVSIIRDDTTIFSSLVASYDASTNCVVLDAPLTITLELLDVVRLSYPDVFTQPYIILILSYNKRKCSAYTTLYLCNVTRGWSRPLRTISDNGRATLVDPLPTDDVALTDVFDIRTDAYVYERSVFEYFEQGIVEMALTATEGVMSPFPSGSVVIFGDGHYALFTVLARNGVYTVGDIIEMSGTFSRSTEYTIYIGEGDDTGLRARVVRQGTVIQHDSGLSIPSPTTHMIYVGDRDDARPFVRLSSTSILLQPGSTAVPSSPAFFGFYPLRRVVTGLQIPRVLHEQCYTIILESLILPNRHVKSTGRLLSFFPYVYVQLLNANSSFSTSMTMSTNHPSMKYAQFICPIGNIKNQTTTQFVELRCNYALRVTMSFFAALSLSVHLPGGSVLDYDEDITAHILANSVVAVFRCSVPSRELKK